MLVAYVSVVSQEGTPGREGDPAEGTLAGNTSPTLPYPNLPFFFLFFFFKRTDGSGGISKEGCSVRLPARDGRHSCIQ